MDEIIAMLESDPSKAIAILMANGKDINEIEKLQKEYSELDRSSRPDQIDIIQTDKKVGEGENQRLVKKVRVPIPLQNKIVSTAVAFEVGEPPSLIPDEVNDLTNEIDRLWKTNRMDSKIQKIKTLQKSELQCAALFYIEDLKKNNFLSRIINTNQNKDIKCTILENSNGEMSPYFDSFNDMKAFTWKFKTKDGDSDVENVWVYTETKVYVGKTTQGKMVFEAGKSHGFSKIPVVYNAQDKHEWYLAQAMIDRLEVSLSRLGDANDYTGHPMVKIWGKVDGAPEKEEEGKAWLITMEENDDGKMEKGGDVDFLTYEQAPESVKLEQNQLERLIDKVTNTPDLTLESLKGLGNVAGVALRLMFLDPEIKAKGNEGDNRTMIERMIAVMISGTVTTTNKAFEKIRKETFFSIQFNSIIPDDVKTLVETLNTAVTGNIMSRKAAVNQLDATDDSEAELAEIEKQVKTTSEPSPPDPGE